MPLGSAIPFTTTACTLCYNWFCRRSCRSLYVHNACNLFIQFPEPKAQYYSRLNERDLAEASGLGGGWGGEVYGNESGGKEKITCHQSLR